MRRITLWLVATTAVTILLFSYRTSLGGAAPSRTAAAAPGIVPAPSAGSGTGPAKSLTVNGTVARTRWGPVQVQVTITNHKITEVRVLQRPTGRDRDEEINTYAVPQLNAEVLQAQGAGIDTVSGATVTSDGYVESLQAALDAAHFG